MSVANPLRPVPPAAPAPEQVPKRNATSSTPLGGSAGAAKGGSTIASKPSLVVHERMRFLIMDAPRQGNLHLYIRECKRHHVTDIVRVCEPTYSGTSDLRNAGIELHEMAYDDGTSPPREVISQWLDLVNRRFFSPGGGGGTGGPGSRAATPAAMTSPSGSAAGTPSNSVQSVNGGAATVGSNMSATSPIPTAYSNDVGNSSEKTIAVHCIAGLGRAPVLVAIALIEYAGFDPVDAVSFIRKHRRGAINEKQLNYLEQYTRQTKQGCNCVIL